MLSVKLFSRVPPQNIRTLALDEGSRTVPPRSCRSFLANAYSLRPELHPLPSATRKLSTARTDAVLLIGDRAIHSLSAGTL